MEAQRTTARPDRVVTPSRLLVLLTEMRCLFATLVMVGRNRIRMPRTLVGRSVSFADGTTSTVYRETALRSYSSNDPVILVVRFRLRLIARSRFWHALFRFESLFNTLLFAGHPGFETKLWMTDLDTGFYRGIYEWDGADAAARYAENLRVVLEPWVERSSFGYRIVPFPDRSRYLDGEHPIRNGDEGAWWLPTEVGVA